MKSVGIVTLGCRVNTYESVCIAEALQSRGFEIRKDTDDCDYYIVNTCSVTAESQRQCRQLVRRCALHGKTAVIGCASQNEAESFREMQNVFYVGGCADKMRVVDAILEDRAAFAVTAMEGVPYESMQINGESALFSTCRSFIKIQDGCNGKCTYCVIPSLRGKSRSRKPEEILDEAKRLIQAGYREVILTGIETSAYNAAPLSYLIEELGKLQKDGLSRVRFGSLSPGSMNDNFLSAAAESPNFMPHVHLSLQSGSDRILRLMNRPYTAEEAMKRVLKLREYIPHAQISADFITGFPGETEEEYRMTEQFAVEANMLHVHAFPYSERRGTPAAEMDGSVPKDIRRERCSRLNAAADALKSGILDGMIGKKVSVLVEKVKNGMANGHTEEYIECEFPANGKKVGDICSVTAVSHDTKRLLGSGEKL